MSDELLKCSEHRLWELIAERARPGADVKALDRRIWDLFGETWAIMFTDLSGFSRQVEKFGILHFLQIILEHKGELSVETSSLGGAAFHVDLPQQADLAGPVSG